MAPYAASSHLVPTPEPGSDIASPYPESSDPEIIGP